MKLQKKYTVPVQNPVGSMIETLTPHFFISCRRVSENANKACLEIPYAPFPSIVILPENGQKCITYHFFSITAAAFAFF